MKNANKKELSKVKTAQVADSEESELEDETFEPLDYSQFDFFRDFTVSKPIKGTDMQRERRILAFGKGGDQALHEDMAKFVNKLATFGQSCN